ncbi:glycosyltransferase family 2 protein [Pontibacillus salicampi]|uniref:Glycosyltransferase family 2 protein n=1 Tax=Pontibacillus salicampi TaxID=1449801 RepID=A0ABV6LHY4_9BACI
MTHPDYSIIFPVKNEGENVKKTLDSLFRVKTNTTFEVIIVDDQSDDDCCAFLAAYPSASNVKVIRTEGVGSSAARNVGAEAAAGEYFVFCDAHLTFEDWWLDRLAQPVLMEKTDVICPAISSMEHPHSVGYGQFLQPNMQIGWYSKTSGLKEVAIVPGACFLLHREVFYEVGGFEKGFRRWGHEDVELSIKLWLFGYRCHVLPTVTIAHLFRQHHPYTVQPEHISYNLLRMAYSHFNTLRINKCRKMIPSDMAKSIEADVLRNLGRQRLEYLERRVFDDNWYFRKFNLQF